MSHTILFTQKTTSKASRTYEDFASLSLCLEAVIKLFETHLKAKNPMQRNISYDIKDLNEYLDSYTDLAVLVADNKTKQYQPYDSAWVKEKIYNHLKRAVSQ